MAKVVVGGNKKGKVGSSIFYTIKNSNNKVTQGERIYQPDVTNPQSELQRAQRMKMKPASNFYNALSGILDHSWQGVKYGAMSRQYFLKLAMSANQNVFPFLVKGSNQFVPGPYPVSKGSLASVAWSLSDFVLSLSIVEENPQEPASDIAAFSSTLLAANPNLRIGDQVSLIAIADTSDNGDTKFTPLYGRFVIDTENSTLISETLPSFQLIDNAGMTATFKGRIGGEGYNLVAAAVIVSRKNTNGGEVWQRSTEYMQVSDNMLQLFMSPEAYTAALNSYLDTQRSYDSDYYLNDAETEAEVSGDLTFDNVSVQLGVAGSSFDVPSVAIAVSPSGVVQAVSLSGRLVEAVEGGTRFSGTKGSLLGSKLVSESVSLVFTGQAQLFTITYNGTDITNKGVSPEQFVERYPQYSL